MPASVSLTRSQPLRRSASVLAPLLAILFAATAASAAQAAKPRAAKAGGAAAASAPLPEAPATLDPLPEEPSTERPPAPVPEAAPAPATPPGAPKARQRVAVYQLEAAGIDARISRVITDSLIAEMRKLERTTVVGMDEIRAMLDMEAQKQLVGCSDVSCLAEIAEALGVDGIVIGNIAVVGDTISIGLKRIDQRNATTLGQGLQRIDSTDPADVLAAIGPLVEQLFPDYPLKAGLTRGVPPEVALRIHPPPLRPWTFWALAGTAGAAAVTGGALTAVNAFAYSAAQTKSKDSVGGTAVPGGVLNADLALMRGSFVGLVVAYSAAALVGAGAGVSALFVDWSGAGNEQ